METIKQPKISGYRQLNEEEAELINTIKETGDQLGAAIEVIESMSDIDKRAVAIAKTHLQTGLMWLVRSIARPNGF